MNDEPVFPTPNGQYFGMGVRDYFAAKAMHQILRGAVLPIGVDASVAFRTVAELAYEIADAMLVERSKATGEQA